MQHLTQRFHSRVSVEHEGVQQSKQQAGNQPKRGVFRDQLYRHRVQRYDLRADIAFLLPIQKESSHPVVGQLLMWSSPDRKPGSVSRKRDPCHLSGRAFTCPLDRPTRRGAKASDGPPSRKRVPSTAYLVFQCLRFTRSTVAGSCRELLPHVFTLIEMLPLRRYSFLWHFLFPENFFPETYPLGSAALCAARTFLCSISNSDGTVCIAKIPKQKAPAIPGLFPHIKAII